MAGNCAHKTSLKCYIGFFLSILCPAIFCLLWLFMVQIGHPKSIVFQILVLLLLIGLVASMVLSIGGVREAKKSNLEGKSVGIAGIIISSLAILIILALVYLFVSLADGLGDLINDTAKSIFSSKWVTALMYN